MNKANILRLISVYEKFPRFMVFDEQMVQKTP